MAEIPQCLFSWAPFEVGKCDSHALKAVYLCIMGFITLFFHWNVLVNYLIIFLEHHGKILLQVKSMPFSIEDMILQPHYNLPRFSQILNTCLNKAEMFHVWQQDFLVVVMHRKQWRLHFSVCANFIDVNVNGWVKWSIRWCCPSGWAVVWYGDSGTV